jgi:septum formation protein
MTEQQIARHIRSETWRDKAGAYAIQETGDEFVERIEGSLTNVMGLPVELLKEMLEKVR